MGEYMLGTAATGASPTISLVHQGAMASLLLGFAEFFAESQKYIFLQNPRNTILMIAPHSPDCVVHPGPPVHHDPEGGGAHAVPHVGDLPCPRHLQRLEGTATWVCFSCLFVSFIGWIFDCFVCLLVAATLLIMAGRSSLPMWSQEKRQKGS